jgi:hypothetical protein
MKSPELLVEYLIVGSFSLFWLIPLLMLLGYISNIQELSNITFALFVPGIYVLGMLIDSIANSLLKRKKYRLKDSILKKYKMEDNESHNPLGHEMEARFVLYEPELLKASQMRSSRDRIARSTVVNFIFLTIVLLLYDIKNNTNWRILAIHIAIGIITTWLCWRMWVRFQILSYHFDAAASRALEDKLSADAITKKEDH